MDEGNPEANEDRISTKLISYGSISDKQYVNPFLRDKGLVRNAITQEFSDQLTCKTSKLIENQIGCQLVINKDIIQRHQLFMSSICRTNYDFDIGSYITDANTNEKTSTVKINDILFSNEDYSNPSKTEIRAKAGQEYNYYYEYYHLRKYKDIIIKANCMSESYARKLYQANINMDDKIEISKHRFARDTTKFKRGINVTRCQKLSN